MLEQQIAQQYSARMKALVAGPPSSSKAHNRNFSHPHYRAGGFAQKKLKGVRREKERLTIDSGAATTRRDGQSGLASHYQTEEPLAPSSNPAKTERPGTSKVRVSLRSQDMGLRSGGNKGFVGLQASTLQDNHNLHTIEDSQTYQDLHELAHISQQ